MTPDLPGWSDLPFWTTDWPRIATAVAAESGPVYPPDTARFRALELCPPDAARVVILGQDPYHTPGKADGLAFSISRDFGGRLDSLGNIFKELRSDLDVSREETDLTGWARQGVLLLNTALTVPEGRPQGHARLGWDRLVAQVLQRLNDRPRAVLLWGGPAQRYRRHLQNPGHLVIESAHPSPLSAHRGYLGSRPFSRVNDWLRARGEAPVDWAL